LLIGFGLAFAGIPYYDYYVYGCHFKPYPYGPLWIVLVFAVIPISFSVLSITISMLFVYLAVRRTSRSSRRWRLGVGNDSMEAKVFW